MTLIRVRSLMMRIICIRDPRARIPVTRVFLFLLMPVLMFVSSCSQDGADAGGQEPPPISKEPVLKVREIPFFEAVVRKPPEQLPYPEVGLRFQRAVRDNDPRLQRFRPIGEARFGPAGDLYITFPSRDLVARFAKPEYALTLFGARAHGGKDEIITNPERLRFVDDQMILSNQVSGQVLVYDAVGQFKNAYELDRPDPIAGPDLNFLLTFTQNPNVFLRVDANNRILQRYQMTDSPVGGPEGETVGI